MYEGRSGMEVLEALCEVATGVASARPNVVLVLDGERDDAEARGVGRVDDLRDPCIGTQARHEAWIELHDVERKLRQRFEQLECRVAQLLRVDVGGGGGRGRGSEVVDHDVDIDVAQRNESVAGAESSREEMALADLERHGAGPGHLVGEQQLSRLSSTGRGARGDRPRGSPTR